MVPTDAKVLGRLIDAWKNCELTNKDVRERFRLSEGDWLELRLRWGLRPEPVRLTERERRRSPFRLTN